MTWMPASCASRGLDHATLRPSSSIVPWSWTYAPEMILMSVLLPAPFSPTRAWISPAATEKSTSCSDLTPGKLFEIVVTLSMQCEMSRVSHAAAAPISARAAAAPAAPRCALRRRRHGARIQPRLLDLERLWIVVRNAGRDDEVVRLVHLGIVFQPAV